MVKTIFTVLLIPLFCISVFANKSVARDSLNTNTVLFKVTHSDSKHVSYLFGTHHALGKPFFDALKPANEALFSCDLLIKENLNIPGHLAKDIINQRTTTTKWEKYLDKKEQQFVLNLFASGSLEFDKMTPAELYAFLSRHYKEEVCVEKDPEATYFSLDDYIGAVAEKNHLELIGLETSEEQIYLINEDVKGMPRKVHKRRLSAMIARLESGSKDLCAEIDWYRSMQFDFKLDQPCANQLVLSDRNDKWMEQIEERLKTNNCFIVVGLSHLMFECGLLNQIKKLGYHIEAVPVK
ncbi:TraB/GumN family protein [Maribellus sediminis]|uniref:TraB/GumN family protein n=1 Tax=Maribellus sediminis TaxID=2696285 RepID=UPI001430F8E3|nr:TraB/GumN family protein [Maribellus sediminis]